MGLHAARRPGQLRRVDGRAGAGAHTEQARSLGFVVRLCSPLMEGWAGLVFMQAFVLLQTCRAGSGGSKQPLSMAARPAG